MTHPRRRALLMLMGAGTLAVAAAFGQAGQRFDFGAARPAAGHTRVLATSIYTTESGFGFDLGFPVECDAKRRACSSERPFFFSVSLAEGNYDVTVTLGGSPVASVTTVKAESRRLMLEAVRTRPGQRVTRTFTVNLRTPRIASGGEVKLKDREIGALDWDDKLTLEFGGTHPSVAGLEIRQAAGAITLYLMGDSTVTDQPREPWSSWGQMLPRFFRAGVAVANHAESGESLRSSLHSRRLDKVMSTIQPGDYLFLQFGHNDQKERGEGVGAFTTYKTDLKHYVAEARARGAHPVLVTSMHRRTFDEAGKVVNSLGDYPEAVRQAAREENLPLIDLNAMSRLFYEALGPQRSALAFVDGSHHNNYGSYELARAVVEGIRAASLPIARYLRDDAGPFDPSRPDAPGEVRIPPSPQRDPTRPDAPGEVRIPPSPQRDPTRPDGN